MREFPDRVGMQRVAPLVLAVHVQRAHAPLRLRHLLGWYPGPGVEQPEPARRVTREVEPGHYGARKNPGMHAALDEVAFKLERLRGAPERHVHAPFDPRAGAPVLHAGAVSLLETRIAQEVRVMLGREAVLVVGQWTLHQRAPVRKRKMDLQFDEVEGTAHAAGSWRST